MENQSVFGIVSYQIRNMIMWPYFEIFDFFFHFHGLLISSSATRPSGRHFTCCYTETEQGDHDFCLSHSHYTDTNQTSRHLERISSPRPLDSESRALPPVPKLFSFPELGLEIEPIPFRLSKRQ